MKNDRTRPKPAGAETGPERRTSRHEARRHGAPPLDASAAGARDGRTEHAGGSRRPGRLEAPPLEVSHASAPERDSVRANVVASLRSEYRASKHESKAALAVGRPGSDVRAALATESARKAGVEPGAYTQVSRAEIGGRLAAQGERGAQPADVSAIERQLERETAADRSDGKARNVAIEADGWTAELRDRLESLASAGYEQLTVLADEALKDMLTELLSDAAGDGSGNDTGDDPQPNQSGGDSLLGFLRDVFETVKVVVVATAEMVQAVAEAAASVADAIDSTAKAISSTSEAAASVSNAIDGAADAAPRLRRTSDRATT